MKQNRGRFITLEGLDGAGKGTQLGWLLDWLTAKGIPYIHTREPGGTPLGEKLRELLLHVPMDLETEAMLMFAARRQHIVEVIQPALEAGQWVVSDRFTDATYAYQGGGRGLALDRIATLERFVQGEQGAQLQPDLTLLLDVPPAVSAERLAQAREPDKFERESGAFFERVRAVYLARATEQPGRFAIIDSTRELSVIRNELAQIMSAFCQRAS